MIETLLVNYQGRDFFGRSKLMSDEVFRPTSLELEKALNAIKKGEVYVHLHYSDGKHDCFYADSTDLADGTWTQIHWEASNSKDDPVRISSRSARKLVRAAFAEEGD